METSASVICNDLHKSFKIAGDEDYPVLKGINLVVNKGDFVALMGPSGSGKSTLLNILGALIPSTTGDVQVVSQILSELSKNQLTLLRRNNVGWIFQDFNLVQNLTALENVLIPLHLQGTFGKLAIERAQALLNKVGLQDKYESLMDQLSGGQQQRVAIARALANNPEVILADEPTGNLDSKAGKDIIKLFKQLAKDGKAIIMVSHDIELAHAADRVYVLRNGILVNEISGMEDEV